MKKLRTILATLRAHRAEADARQIRRDLRNATRQLSAAAVAAERRARGLRLFAAWTAPRSPQTAAQPALPRGAIVYGNPDLICLSERKSA